MKISATNTFIKFSEISDPDCLRCDKKTIHAPSYTSIITTSTCNLDPPAPLQHAIQRHCNMKPILVLQRQGLPKEPASYRYTSRDFTSRRA